MRGYVHFYNLIYLAALLFGAVVSTLSRVLYLKEKSRLHRKNFTFSILLFSYILLNAFIYYILQTDSLPAAARWLIILGDISFFPILLYWVHIATCLIGRESTWKFKILLCTTVVYVVVVEYFAAVDGQYINYFSIISAGRIQWAMGLLNCAYDLLIIAVGLRLFLSGARRLPRGYQRTVALSYCATVAGYMLWVLFCDYMRVFHGATAEMNLLRRHPRDPIMLLYFLLGVLQLYYFCKKDPLKLTVPQVSGELAVTQLAKRYRLTAREAEVLELINCGKSNAQIGEALFIAENTVKRHINNLLKKVGVQNRHELLSRLSGVSSVDLLI